MSRGKLQVRLRDAQATAAFGAAMARALKPAAVIWLQGDLGAGKTTLARGAIQHFDPGARVRSPTYSLIESYVLPPFNLHHLDLYRVRDPSELDVLGLRELNADVLLIEWPEKGGEATPAADLDLILRHTESDQRSLEVAARSPMGSELLPQLRQFLQTAGYKQAADDGFE